MRNGDAGAPPDARYNFAILTLDGLSFWLGMSYFSPTTILPLFVSYLAPSNVFVGAVPAVVFLCWALPQLAGARAVGRQSSRKWYIVRTALLGRLPLAAAVVATAFLATERPELTLVLFLAGFGLFRLTGGLNTPAYYELVATAIAPRVRARFIGFSQFLGGAVGAAGLIAGRRVLDAFPFPGGFVICFTLGLVFMTGAIGFMAAVREPPAPVLRAPPLAPKGAGGGLPGGAALLGSVGEALARDGALRRYLAGRILLAMGSLASAFFAVQAARTLGASDGDVAAYTAILLASQVCSTLLWGALADRAGLAPVLLAAAGIGTAAPAAALLAPTPAWFAVVFVLAGVAAGALAVTDASVPLALAEGAGAGRAHYVALANTVLAPFQVAAPLIGEFLADAGGYGVTSAAALAVGIAATLAIALTAPRARRR